jgi:hypothetical protein
MDGDQATEWMSTLLLPMAVDGRKLLSYATRVVDISEIENVRQQMK